MQIPSEENAIDINNNWVRSLAGFPRERKLKIMQRGQLKLHEEGQPKGRGRRRTFDWCAIGMDEYAFVSTDEVIREDYCLKKIAIVNCAL